ncbi:hypothetical protein [Flavobacterium quisquiliarum]|jgi:hypothetical protein|uniref:Replication restart DNA helicase PriA n=1 Tax=Flavobacterium quisquiliarum TaxID=1834436 RepID=A0ABV8VYG8_9FLAO|nr:hypothetical protein [Flavobacterium quisquiliarum]MBW1655886.1 hypothetical protein [Flavobacterium quisquiliarum]NWL01367.1 hypothetical protein [Flavobacterium collinsii]
MERFQDENKWLGHFYNEIFVKCPKCESKGVLKEIPRNCECGKCTTMTFECKSCFHKIDEPVYQYKALGKHYCSNCYEKFDYESQIFKERPEMYQVKCPHCSFNEEIKPAILRTRKEPQKDGLVREPWHNLQLWFQKEVRGNVFWVYNQEHLVYLEKYIKADLRERNNNGSGNGTMVSRLPKFIKEAKNRGKLLKILEKWKE